MIVALAIWLGPCYRQVLGGTDRHVSRWVMYSGVALDLVEVRYERALPGGGRATIDHYRALGYASAREAPPRLFRIVSLQRALVVGRELCTALGPDAHVHLHARKAERDGFRVIADGREDLCSK